MNNSNSDKTEPSEILPLWLAILLVLLMVILVRESSVIICNSLGISSAANIIGLVFMFFVLFIWRVIRQKANKSPLPSWMTNASNKLLIESGFAFLPVSAGAGLLLFALKDEFWGVVATTVLSTLLPLWGLAKLTDYWLKDSK